MRCSGFWRALCVATAFARLAGAGHAGEVKVGTLTLEGETFLHDPSRIINEAGRYFIFNTGRGISSMSSPDLVHWSRGPSVFRSPPAWAMETVPGYRGYTWAPDIIRLNGRYLLYYSVSTFGQQVSAIGLATNQTLNPAAATFRWTDCGRVIDSTNGSPYNAIDPAVALDGEGGLWMAFGSFWRGIYLVQLNPETGLRAREDSPLYRLAWNESIEAPTLVRHGSYYYLFVNWGICCRGTNSTYEVRVGRSRTITGPYRDRDGRDMISGGGSLVLESSGRFIGPGHVSLFDEGDTEWFSCHYYDAESRGRSRLLIGQMKWSEDGWPFPAADLRGAGKASAR